MSRKFLVDGYNLMHKIPAVKQKMGGDLEAARHDLVRRLSIFGSGKNCSITVVFDGRSGYSPTESGAGGVKVIFSRGPEKADPLIKRIIDQQGGGSMLNVVTSDHEILNYARLYSCTLLTSEDFISMMSLRPNIKESVKPEIKMNKNDLAEWLDMFQNESGKTE